MEYFVVANSYAAPFFSDLSEKYVEGETPMEAMKKFIEEYTHPCGLYAADVYTNADAYYKRQGALVRVINKYKRDELKGVIAHGGKITDGLEFIEKNE